MILGVKVLRRFVKSNAALIPELASDSWNHSFDRWSRAFDPRSQPFDPWSESHIPRYYPVRKWLFSHFLLHMLWKLKWTRCVPTFSSSRKWRELANQFQEQIMYQSKATSTRVSIPCWSWNRQCVILKFWTRLATAWFRSCRQFFCRSSTITTWNDHIFISL